MILTDRKPRILETVAKMASSKLFPDNTVKEFVIRQIPDLEESENDAK